MDVDVSTTSTVTPDKSCYPVPFLVPSLSCRRLTLSKGEQQGDQLRVDCTSCTQVVRTGGHECTRLDQEVKMNEVKRLRFEPLASEARDQ